MEIFWLRVVMLRAVLRGAETAFGVGGQELAMTFVVFLDGGRQTEMGNVFSWRVEFDVSLGRVEVHSEAGVDGQSTVIFQILLVFMTLL